MQCNMQCFQIEYNKAFMKVMKVYKNYESLF